MNNKDLDKMEREAAEIRQIDEIIVLLEDKITEIEIKLASEGNGR